MLTQSFASWLAKLANARRIAGESERRALAPIPPAIRNGEDPEQRERRTTEGEEGGNLPDLTVSGIIGDAPSSREGGRSAHGRDASHDGEEGVRAWSAKRRSDRTEDEAESFGAAISCTANNHRDRGSLRAAERASARPDHSGDSRVLNRGIVRSGTGRLRERLFD